MKGERRKEKGERGSEVDSHRPSELSPRCFEIVGYRLASILLTGCIFEFFTNSISSLTDIDVDSLQILFYNREHKNNTSFLCIQFSIWRPFHLLPSYIQDR